MPFDKRKWIMSAIRRASYRWGPRSAAKVNARVERGKYLCGACHKIHPAKEVELDHKNPVINPETGWVDWNTFIDRLFVEEDGFQVLCIDCHRAKSIEENSHRTKK